MTARICQFLSRVDHGWKSLEIIGLFQQQRQRNLFSWVTPGEDIKLKVADVVVAREVDRRLECHRLQTGGYRVHLRVLKVTWACQRIICQQHLSWALQVPEKITSLSVSLNIFQGTMVRSPKEVLQKSAASLQELLDGNQLQCFVSCAHLLVILKLSPAKTPWGNTALSSLSI